MDRIRVAKELVKLAKGLSRRDGATITAYTTADITAEIGGYDFVARVKIDDIDDVEKALRKHRVKFKTSQDYWD